VSRLNEDMQLESIHTSHAEVVVMYGLHARYVQVEDLLPLLLLCPLISAVHFSVHPL
jgi:hypothetical protein